MKTITERLSVSPQPSEADLDHAARSGVRTIINNRPDHEDPDKLSVASQKAKAEALGMAYVHIPVTPGDIRLEQVKAFQDAVQDSEGPVLAHCRTGTRSLTLFAIGEVLDGRLKVEDLDELGRKGGADLAGAKAWLKAHS